MTAIGTHARRLDSVDLLKFVLSVMVVAIHINPFGTYSVYVRPLLRTAVPLFFLVSSYFFFRRFSQLEGADKRIERLEKYVRRNLALYAFWFVVLLVPTVELRGYLGHGLLNGLYSLLHGFFFGSTFRASWFLMAGVIATVLVAAASRYLSNRWLFVLSLIPFVACCCLSNYAKAPLVADHVAALKKLFDGSYNSFWVAIFWVVAGKILAEREGNPRHVALGAKGLGCASFCGLAVLYLEQFVVVRNGWSAANDCYFALPLVCIPLFLLVLRADISLPHTDALRAASTVTYCLHFTLFYVMKNYLHIDLAGDAMYALALLTCWLVTVLILKLERKPHLGWLKYAH